MTMGVAAATGQAHRISKTKLPIISDFLNMEPRLPLQKQDADSSVLPAGHRPVHEFLRLWVDMPEEALTLLDFSLAMHSLQQQGRTASTANEDGYGMTRTTVFTMDVPSMLTLTARDSRSFRESAVIHAPGSTSSQAITP
jgi:hypothetical protein